MAMLKGHRYWPEILLTTEQWQVQNKTIHIFKGGNRKKKKIWYQEVEDMY